MTTKTTKKKNAKSPEKKSVVDVDLGEFDMKKVKAKTTIYLDGDIWDALHLAAEKEGMKYQPYLNKLLRRVLLNEKNELEQRVERLEAALIKSKAI